jgi:hypothetical protein
MNRHLRIDFQMECEVAADNAKEFAGLSRELQGCIPNLLEPALARSGNLWVWTPQIALDTGFAWTWFCARSTR